MSPSALVLEGIQLEEGWNLIPFLHHESMPLEEALASIADAVVLVKGEDGAIYAPTLGINTLRTLRPGKSHKIYVDRSVKLTYP